MTKVKKAGFIKGASANPKGRPKGTISPLKKQLLELRKRAAEDIPTAYKILWDDFNNGDPAAKQLAKQIYFKELVSIPTDWLNQTVVVAQEDGVDRLEAITKALPQFEELTHNEAMDEMRTLKTIEPEAKKEEGEDIYKLMSDEQLKIIHSMYEEAKNKAN